MIEITQKQNCSGCTACYCVCPTGAISLLEDSEGFLYPKVDKDKCTDCGLCNKVCPFTKREHISNKNINITAYATKHLSKEVLNESTSGGMFTALSDYILSLDGVIYGAAFDDSFNVVHIRAEDAVNRDRMRGSKYVQSNLNAAFKSIKEDLRKEKYVLFTGTPCHVDGLKAYLKKDYEKLFCCDLICHGSPSPKVWKSYVEFLENTCHSKLVSYKFRPKKFGWYQHNELSVFENGKEFHSCAKSNLFRELYYSRLIMRPACHNCKYTNLLRPSDITIADCRGIDNVIKDFDAYDGASLVILNNNKGKDLFSLIPHNLKYYEVDINKLLQPPLKEPSKPNSKRDLFFNIFNSYGLEKAIFEVWGRMYFVKQAVKKLIKK